MINYDEFWEIPYSERSLAIACTRGRQAVVSCFSTLLAKADMSEQQWRVMRVLGDFNPIRLSELCDKTSIHKVSMTRIVRVLTVKGYVEVSRDKEDKRTLNISITNVGKDFNTHYAVDAAEISQKIVHSYGMEKSMLLLVLLDDLAKLDIEQSGD
jgi:DNA-binding MarR family transcriptional regulator